LAPGNVLISIGIAMDGMTLDGWTIEEVDTLKASIRQSVSILTSIPLEYFGDVIFLTIAPTSSDMKTALREINAVQCSVTLGCPSSVRIYFIMLPSSFFDFEIIFVCSGNDSEKY